MENVRVAVGYSIQFDYVNWRGEKGVRKALVEGFEFGANEWHTSPHWLMVATDLEKGEQRYFDLKDMQNVVRIG